jgi:hypothetical protein
MPVDYTKQYERHRILPPGKFKKTSFRTHDIGKKGFSKRIAGQIKGTNKWMTQSLLISRAEPATMKRKLRKEAKYLRKLEYRKLKEVI